MWPDIYVGEVGQKEVAQSRIFKRWSDGGANEDLECVGVDVRTGSLVCKVDAGGACVRNG